MNQWLDNRLLKSDKRYDKLTYCEYTLPSPLSERQISLGILKDSGWPDTAHASVHNGRL